MTPRGPEERSNGITALRFLLALAVLVFHAWPLGGFGPDPLMALTGGRLDGGGTLAVSGFFGLSGFLVTRSRIRHDRVSFALRRAARILPAYWAVVLATAVFLGPAYVLAAGLPSPLAGDVTAGVFAAQPLQFVNGSLWTLWPEVLCYSIVTVLPRRFLSVGLLSGASVLAIVSALDSRLAFDPDLGVGPCLAFVVGGLIGLHRLHPTALASLATLLVAYLTVGTTVGVFAVGAACAITAIWVGVRLPLQWTADMSYGTYLIAFPVAQSLVAFGWSDSGPALLAMGTAALTLPLAALSWRYVERPAIRWASVRTANA